MRRINPAAAAAVTTTCKVVSDTEVEIQYPDQTTRRVAIPSATALANRRLAGAAAARADVALTQATASADTRGFDENGDPYVDEHMPDGSIRRHQQNQTTIIKPDGTRQTVPVMRIFSNVQPGTPPELPADPSQGRVWVEQHNAAILGLISDLVHGDSGEMGKFTAAEARATGGDLFRQVAYRTKVATFLAGGQ
jgi:hypothetical protein